MTDDRTSDRDSRVRERAYQRWEAEGRPAGRHDDHWHEAAREVDGEDRSPISVESVQAAAAITPDMPAKKARAKKAPAADPAAPRRKRAVKPKAAD